MFNFKKQTDELKKDIHEEVQELVDNGKVLSIGILAISCLTIGYALGSITTGLMCKTVSKVY